MGQKVILQENKVGILDHWRKKGEIKKEKIKILRFEVKIMSKFKIFWISTQILAVKSQYYGKVKSNFEMVISNY